MFGHRASTEPQRLWLCGDVAWAGAGSATAANDLISSEKYLGTGRRCL